MIKTLIVNPDLEYEEIDAAGWNVLSKERQVEYLMRYKRLAETKCNKTLHFNMLAKEIGVSSIRFDNRCKMTFPIYFILAQVFYEEINGGKK